LWFGLDALGVRGTMLAIALVALALAATIAVAARMQRRVALA
jgi:hypothetical protein